MQPTIIVTLDRFEATKAVLRLADGQELVVERALLPSNTHEGAQLYLELKVSLETEDTKRIEARDLLKAILADK